MFLVLANNKGVMRGYPVSKKICALYFGLSLNVKNLDFSNKTVCYIWTPLKYFIPY